MNPSDRRPPVTRHGRAVGPLVRLAVLTTALLIFAAPALAATHSWSWTMNLRYVSGKANGVTYTFGTGGTMTFAGDVRAYSKDPWALPSPYTIQMRVYRMSFPDQIACSASRTPSSTLNVKRSFTADCGTEPADTYYIVAYTTEDDGWNKKGAGTLKMP